MCKLTIPLYYMIPLLICIIIRNYTDKEYTSMYWIYTESVFYY